MQVSVEAGEGLERRMTVELVFDDLEKETQKRLQQFARTARLPGFRPGKVPMRVLQQRYGAQLQQEAFSELMQSSYGQAIEQEQLEPAAMPRIEPEIDSEQRRAAYTAIFEVMPKVELVALDGHKIKRPVCELTDADLETMIERLRKQRQTWEPVERAAVTGDRLTISFVGKMDGEPFAGGTAEHVELELGSGRMIPGFEDGLLGATGGETRALDLHFPEEYQQPGLAGKAATFEVTVEAVAEPMLPEVDADFIRSYGIESGELDELRQDVRANMEREVEQRLRSKLKDRVMDLLQELHTFDIPQVLIAQEQEQMAGQMRHALGNSGSQLPLDLFADGARRRVALGLIVGEFIRTNEMQVDEARVTAHIEKLAASYEDPKALVEYYSNAQQRRSLEGVVLEEQVVDTVLEQVEVEDEAIAFEDLASSER